jgi:hypothetical protein
MPAIFPGMMAANQRSLNGRSEFALAIYVGRIRRSPTRKAARSEGDAASTRSQFLTKTLCHRSFGVTLASRVGLRSVRMRNFKKPKAPTSDILE